MSESASKRVLWEASRRQFRRQPIEPASGNPSPRSPRRQPILDSPSPRRSYRWVKRFFLFLVLLIIVTGGVFGYKIIAASNKISSADRSVLGQLKDLLFNQGEHLLGEQEGRINILLLAVGGEGHKGQDLADTIMVASMQPKTNQVALLSIPRDLYVQMSGEQYYSKINAVHAHGESIRRDQGPALLMETVEEITGLPMHYYGRIDFIAFKQIVDAVGGVTITIDNSFFDYWHKIAFSAGTEVMDGERALAYVRARYVEGPDGGDFKRAERQQQVLLALREKVFSVSTALDFTALNSILNSLSDNIRTDLQLWEMKRFYELARNISSEQVTSNVLTTGPTGLLVGSTEILGGTPASVLKPRTGNYREIHELAANLFENGNHLSVSPGVTPPEEATPEPTPKADTLPLPTIEIRNGTNTTGLAKQTSDNLETKGYQVAAIGNAATRDLTTTTVYILNNSYTEQAKTLAEILGAKTNSGLPSEETASEAELLILLGADAT